MKIVADENIPYVREAFAQFGEVVLVHGREVGADTVRDADALLVRSITKVNARLLEGSKVRFVGTATIGEDHIDKTWLEANGITFSSAPGSNADSVAQYLTAALLVLGDWRGFEPQDKVLGIIGHGNVGTRVEAKARALGMECVLNDPPLERKTGDPKYRPLDELLRRSDIITVHVPLTGDGPDATRHLLNTAFFDRVKTGVIIINTARGAVADGTALREALESGKVGASVLDVWENEPNIDLNLFANLALGTPHIAGYSFDGKVNGTRQLYEAFCAFSGVTPSWDPRPLLPEPECPFLEVNGDADQVVEVRKAVLSVYDIREDDKRLRQVITLPAEERGKYFDCLRKEYPRRREFHNTRVRVTPENAALTAMVRGLGFKLEG
jgi:erythronate-4-phosphate dehydrogenase